MMWILLVTIMTFDGVTSQQIPMSEANCKHYEAQYNSRTHDNTIAIGSSVLRVVYKAQCLRSS